MNKITGHDPLRPHSFWSNTWFSSLPGGDTPDSLWIPSPTLSLHFQSLSPHWYLSCKWHFTSKQTRDENMRTHTRGKLSSASLCGRAVITSLSDPHEQTQWRGTLHVLSISSFPHPFSKWECLHLKSSPENSPEARDLTLPAQRPPVFGHLRGQQPTSLTTRSSFRVLYALLPLLSFSSICLLIVIISQGAVLGCHCSPTPATPASPSVRTATVPTTTYTRSQRAIPLTAKPGILCSPPPNSVCEDVLFFSLFSTSVS